MDMQPIVRAQGLTKQVDTGRSLPSILQDESLEIAPGEVVAILNTSRCDFEKAVRGRATLGGEPAQTHHRLQREYVRGAEQFDFDNTIRKLESDQSHTKRSHERGPTSRIESLMLGAK